MGAEIDVPASRRGAGRKVVETMQAVYDFEQSVPAGYVSLPFADPALPLDDAEVLPVELTAGDVEMFGIDPVEAMGSSAPTAMKAEILIGMDGWRAPSE